MRNKNDTLHIGMIGLGTVGMRVASELQENAPLLRQRTGSTINVVAACVRDISKKRSEAGLDFRLTDDPAEVIDNPDIDLVIELMGGISPAKEFILRAIKNDKHVITANKALLAFYGGEISLAAKEKRRFVGYEGAVAGGIPIIKLIREGLVANKVTRLEGIINGTCNYVLTGMQKRQVSFEEILKEAQKLGFAEADPSFDIDGIDAAQKLAIIASLLFGIPIDFERIYTDGISNIELDDLNYAEKLGYQIKHLAIASRSSSGFELRVHPTLVAHNHMLAAVDREMNAVVLKADLLGSLLISGAGAGAGPTASSVLSDVADCIRASGNDWQPTLTPLGGLGSGESAELPVIEVGKIESAYYFRVNTVDEPGILASITKVLAASEISIEAIVQHEDREAGGLVPIVIITEKVMEEKACLAADVISKMEGVRGSVKRFRVQKP